MGPAPAHYLFDDYSLDTRLIELRLRGEVIRLQPKPLDLLLFLVENRSRVVLKSELLAHLWPGLAVTENALAQAICAVREALAEAGPDAIQCVRGRGYRFTRSSSETSSSASNGLSILPLGTDARNSRTPCPNGPPVMKIIRDVSSGRILER